MKRLFKLSNQGCAEQIAHLFDSVGNYHIELDLNPDDVVLFEGGTDANPMLYGETPGKYTDWPDTKRDAFESGAFKDAQKHGAACLGICRGSQFLTVMSGGELIQHVNGHGGSHKVETYDNRNIIVTSTHHQMMAPMDAEYKLIAWSDPARSKHYLNGNNEECKKSKLLSTMLLEPEIVWYPKTRSLAVQGHPEYMSSENTFPQYYFELIKKFIFNEQ